MSLGILIDAGRSQTSFKSDLVSIDFDVTLDEKHSWTNDVTSNPVEIGEPITDHIRGLPDELSLTGMISDSPISYAAVIRKFSSIDGGEFESRVQTHFDLLRKIKEEKKTVTVYTKYRIYKDMAIKQMTLPRSAGIGNAIEFSIDFIAVKFVEAKTAKIPAGISKKEEAKADDAKGKTGKKSDIAKKTQSQKKAGVKAPVDKTTTTTTTAKTPTPSKLEVRAVSVIKGIVNAITGVK